MANAKLNWMRALTGGNRDDGKLEDPLQQIREVLGDDLTKPESWIHDDVAFAKVRGPYYEGWRDLPGGHKVYSYFRAYEKVFAPYRGQEIKLLEVGVYQGASLRAWRNYLGPQAVIVGADIDERCKKSEDAADGIHVRIGDQSDAKFLEALVEEFGPFDVIVDDGSHRTDHQLVTFRKLFDGGLKSPGLFFIEDTCTSLWNEYRVGPHDIFDLVNACSLGMNYFYVKHGYADYTFDKHPAPFSVPRITKLVEEVRVFDSAIAIYKAGPNYYPPLVKHN
jgi:hypothetical protein